MSRMLVNRIALVAIAGLCAGVCAGGETARPVGDAGHECAMCAWAARAGGVPYDGETGRSLLNYPKHPRADFQHMKLEIEIADMNKPRLSARQTLTLTPVGFPLERLELDARGMKIESVECEGKKVEFEAADGKLSIGIEPAAAVGEKISVVTRYNLENPPEGLVWTPESAAWPGRAAQLHTQGQPETNSWWFPSHDFPNERLTTELIVGVPQGFQVVSNGRLVGVKRGVKAKDGSGALGAYDVFHWAQDAKAGGDHVNYLVSLVVGKFDVVDVGTPALPMPVYVPVGRGGDVAGTYGKTSAMVETFAKILDEPYPWAKYAQTLVWNFGAGGMENTSATTMYDTAVISREGLIDTDLEGLISHELAHQWFGDLITCKSWEHIWLNEGFATYLTALWFERSAGGNAKAKYLSQVRGAFDGVTGNDVADAPAAQGMVSKAYDDPFEAFRRPSNPYSKGASFLHMLRKRLGDELFFKGVALYVERFKRKNAETADFRKVMEEISGEGLEEFFWQWTARPGVPKLNIDAAWTDDTETLSGQKKGTLRVNVQQGQKIDGYNPAFSFMLPVWIETGVSEGSGEPQGRWLNIDVKERTASAEIVLDRDPGIVAVDPELTVLANVVVTQPAERWVAQLKRGTTYAAKVQAARAIGQLSSSTGENELVSLALDVKAMPELRVEAIRALEARGNPGPIETIVAAQVKPPLVREASLDSYAKVAAKPEGEIGARLRGRAEGIFVKAFENEKAHKTRAAAVRGLGAIKASDRIETILAAAEVDSQDDVIRIAAIDAIGQLKSLRGLPVVRKLAAPGTLSRTRASAVATLARLAHHDRDGVFELVVSMLKDSEARTRRAARQAMLDLEDPRGLAELEKIASESPVVAERVDAQRLVNELKARVVKPSSGAPVRK